MASDQQDIIASIRLGLDQLEKDINNAQAKITKFDKNVTNEGNKTGKGFSNQLSKGFADVGKAADDMGKRIVSAFGPVAIAMTAINAVVGLAKKAWADYQQSLKDAKKASDDFQYINKQLGTDFETNEKLLRNLTQAQKEYMASLTELGKRKEEADIRVSKGLSGQLDYEKEILNIKGEQYYQSEKNIRKQEEELELEIAALYEMRVGYEYANETIDEFRARMLQVNDSIKEQAEGIRLAAIEQTKLEDAYIRQKETVQKILDDEKNIADAKTKTAKQEKVVLGEVEKRKQIEAEINKQIKEINKAAENEAAHLKESGASEEELLNLEKERDKQLKSIYQTGVSQLDLLSAEYNVNKELSPRLFAQREAWAQSRDAIKESVDYTQAQLDMMNEISDALAEQAIATAQEKGDILLQVELQKQLIDVQRQRAMEAMQQTDEFKALLPETQTEVLASFQAVTDGMKTQAEAAIREAGKAREEVLTNQADALAEITIAEAAKNAALTGDIQTQIDLENKLMQEQRARARELLILSAEYQTASDEERAVLVANFDAITASMEKPVTAADKFNAAMSSTIGKAAQSVASGAMDMVSNIGGMMIEQLQHDTQEAIAVIDEKLALKKAEIEEARNQSLMEAGFLEAQTSEDMQAKIDAAKEAGDEVLQYELERRQQEMAINEEYDAQAKEAEEKAAREKVELQYKADMAAYKQKILDTTLTIAQSIASAVSAGMQFGPAAIAMVPVLTAMAAALGGAQMAVLLSNPPKKPAFADGGIVPGNPRLGDVQQILATGGEGVFTADQMEAMGMMANNGGGGQTVVLNATFMLDTETIGKATFNWANANGAVLQARAVIGL